MSSERTDPITALAQLQAEAAALQGGPPEAESVVPGQVSIVFDDLPLPPRRDAEVPPPDPALLREQLQADLLREQLAQQQIETLNQRNRSRFLHEEQNHIREYRRKYSRRVFWVTCAWLMFTALLIVGTGFKNAAFHLSDTVLVATLGSALAGVIGMFLVILNWLYPRSDKPDGK